MKHGIIILGMVLMVGVLAACSSGDQSASDIEPENVVAKVDDKAISTELLERAIATLSPSKQEEFNTPGGRVKMVDKLITEELFYREAQKLDYKNLDHIQKAMDTTLRKLLVNEYYQRHVEAQAQGSEEQLMDFYEANKEAYTKMEIVRAQHIFSKDKEKLVEFKRQIDAGEIKMTTLAHKYSEDVFTRDDGGDLGYFNPDGYIRGMGYQKEISDLCFSLPVGVISDPVKWEKGWSLLRVNEYRPAELRSFEDVRYDIVRMFIARNKDRVEKELFEALTPNYDVTNYLKEEFKLTQRTPEELWNLAQTSQDSYHRVESYSEIITRFPESNYAPQAQFMIGFVYAEELMDKVEAERAFTRVINLYPDDEVARTAQWMLENLDKPLPQFESLDDIKKQAESE